MFHHWDPRFAGVLSHAKCLSLHTPCLCGERILSPAVRDRIRVDRMIDRNNRIGEVLGASIEIQKGVNVTPPEGLCPPLCTLCLCGETNLLAL